MNKNKNFNGLFAFDVCCLADTQACELNSLLSGVYADNTPVAAANGGFWPNLGNGINRTFSVRTALDLSNAEVLAATGVKKVLGVKCLTPVC
jgi:hypothetical protein